MKDVAWLSKKNKINVLHVFNEINFSGAEVMYASAANFFNKEGFILYAISTGKNIGSYSNIFELNGIVVDHIPIKKTKNLFKLIRDIFFIYYRIFRYLKSKKIQVLHIHRSDLNFIAVVASLAGVVTIKTQHSLFKNRSYTHWIAILQRFVLRNIFSVVYQSIGKDVFLNELNYYKNQTVLISNWYDGTKFYPAVNEIERTRLREKLSIDKNIFVVISVGSCTANKSHSDIFHSLAKVKNFRNFIYLHIGTGELESYEVNLSNKLGLNEFVTFAGNTSNVRDYLIAADVFIMTSQIEGLGIAAIEAMACGLPTILYNSPGLSELNNNGSNGFLINRDEKSLTKKILLLLNNKNIGIEMGRNAIQFVVGNYSMEINAKKITDLYRKKL